MLNKKNGVHTNAVFLCWKSAGAITAFLLLHIIFFIETT